MNKFFLAAVAALICTVAPAQDHGDVVAQADGYMWPSDGAVLEKLDRWQDLKFGVLIHWGLYSVPGIVESWSICNEDWITRPEGSDYEEYKKWYWGLSKEFNPVDFDPSQWAEACADAGMKYVIFTTKHHDGFCMYDSRFTDFTIAKGPFADDPRSDVAKHVLDAFRVRGFMTGAYFSKPDWHHHGFWNPYYATPDRMPNYRREMHPDWWESYVKFTQDQLGEITGGRYGSLDILWLDGGWIAGGQIGLDGILEEARRHNPGMLSVDRTIGGPDENYQTPERMVPDAQIAHPWESCLPLSNDWGWVPDAPYKSARTVVNTLAEITAKGGCLVLGVGPTAQGLIEEREVKILRKIGDWLSVNGEAIYGTRITPDYHQGRLWFTASKDGKYLYAVYALPEGESLPKSISWKGNVPEGKAVLLSGGRKLKTVVKDGTVTVTLPGNLPDDSIALRLRVSPSSSR